MAACGPLVLVIDDNEGLVSLLQRYLTDQTCRVVAATSGEEGLRLAQQLRPAAIVLDVMMPVMHGWEVLQRLRAHQQTTDIPVIICSVFNNPELAQALGATLFLPKPIRQEEILAALARLSVV
jgi:CheY-like chemotaxis protein